MSPLYVILIVLAIVGAWVIFAYNNFVRMVNRAKEAWADIDVQLKRRYDLIPNLLESVKGYVKHERETLEKVTAARVAAMDAGGIAEKGKAENMLIGAPKPLSAATDAS